MNLIGRTVGQNMIVESIGQGGMASVYRAYQPALQRFVAIKVLPTRHAIANGFSERFVREARAVAQLNHPNILPILDFGQEEEFSYIVTKLVTGGTLKDRMGQAMNLPEFVRTIEQIAAALDHAHERGILHRDVKPSNVLLDEGDWVQLADFGLAKMMAGDTGLTTSGVGVGTPAYMSPEQGQGLSLDRHTDIYSLGVVLYEMVTGRLPYQAETPMAIIFKHIYEPLTLPRLVRPDIPPMVEAVILKAMEKKPDDRYPSGGEMARALREAVEISETGAVEALKPFATPSDEVSVQPTLALEEEPAEAAPPPVRDVAPERALVPEITPPPELPGLPEVEGFVGREEELSCFSGKLETLNLVVITGMAGVGKTALATQLIQQIADPDRTFWHSFHENEGAEAVIWKLAGYLFWRGQEDLWRMLQGAQQNGGLPPPTEVLLDYLLQMIRGQGFLLCLDDLHFVADDPLLAQLVERLHQAVVTAELSLVITSRHTPESVPTTEFEPLTGLNPADSRALLTVRGVSLPDELVDDLYAQTEGNAQLLILAIETLKRTQNPRHVIVHLAEADDIERYLMSEVDAGLTPDERAVMSGVAVLLGYPGTRDAIEAVLDGGSVRRILLELTRRHLLTIIPCESGREYAQHITVRAFYYGLLGRRERQEMHRRAGAYYEIEEPHTLKAALHYQRAGEHERAAQLATDDVWGFINRGQARALGRLLDRFTDRQLDTELWIAVNIARGQVFSFLRDSQRARQSYQEALSQLTTLADSPAVRESKAHACRGMGELLEYEAPQEALDWLRRGLEELAGASAQVEAALLIKIGSVQIGMGNFADASDVLEKALELLPDGSIWQRAAALTNLGNVYSHQGDIEHATTFTQQALEITQQMNDYFGMLVLQSNLAIEKEIAGDWEEAAIDHQQALALAEKLGGVAEQVAIESNLGLLYTNRGDIELAMTRLGHALELARAHNLNEQLVHILSNLADLHLRQEEPETAKPLLVEAERVALELNSKYQLPEVYRGWARLQLANGQPGAAMKNAERSVNLARELGLQLEEGISLRILGLAMLADNQIELAVAALEDSLSLLADQDPYEAARTKMEWGRYLNSDTSTDRGRTLLQQAQVTFRELGARRDLTAVDEILGT